MKNERAGHTWQPAALVNELYLELARLKGLDERHYGDDHEKAALLNLAGPMMHRLLIHYARPMHRRLEQTALNELPEPATDGAQRFADVLIVL